MVRGIKDSPQVVAPVVSLKVLLGNLLIVDLGYLLSGQRNTVDHDVIHIAGPVSAIRDIIRRGGKIGIGRIGQIAADGQVISRADRHHSASDIGRYPGLGEDTIDVKALRTDTVIRYYEVVPGARADGCANGHGYTRVLVEIGCANRCRVQLVSEERSIGLRLEFPSIPTA